MFNTLDYLDHNCTIEAMLNIEGVDVFEQQEIYNDCVNGALINDFDANITSNQLDSLFDHNDKILHRLRQGEFGKLGKIAIYNNEIFFKCNVGTCNSWMLDAVGYFTKLSKRIALPNTEFLISLDDNLGGDYIPEIKSFNLEEIHLATTIPMFSWSKNNLSTHIERNLLLLPDVYMLQEGRWDEVKKNIESASVHSPWREKIDKAHWAGSMTNLRQNDMESLNPRVKLILFSHNYENFVDARFSDRLDPRFFKNTPGGEELKEIVSQHLSDFKPKEESLKYKYLISVDGHSSCFERVAWILSSNSLLIKQKSNEIEWYDMLLVPFKNFVPVKEDLSDLLEKITWCRNNDIRVQEIIKNANKLGQFLFTREAIDNFTYHAINSYAKKFQNIKVEARDLVKYERDVFDTIHRIYMFKDTEHAFDIFLLSISITFGVLVFLRSRYCVRVRS